ncbi:hypothetical protein BJX64DRAFT_265693 [Aspergillus heterothallicus]
MGFSKENLDCRLNLGQNTIPTYQIGFCTWNIGLEIWIMLPSIPWTENRSIKQDWRNCCSMSSRSSFVQSLVPELYRSTTLWLCTDPPIRAPVVERSQSLWHGLATHHMMSCREEITQDRLDRGEIYSWKIKYRSPLYGGPGLGPHPIMYPSERRRR